MESRARRAHNLDLQVLPKFLQTIFAAGEQKSCNNLTAQQASHFSQWIHVMS